ncbi:T9SS type A sorting domain-containing protein [Aureispira anguillae]|nr:T9SS type A sorting domain-containing protein [Aureispira anguillae]
MKKLLWVVMGLCFLINQSLAQAPHQGRKDHKPLLSKEAKQELQEFHKKEIYPIKKATHDQFLKSLSQDDIAFLESKRAESKTLHQEAQALRQEMKALRTSGKDRKEIREEMKTAFEPIREKRKAFMESMKPFMERNMEVVKQSMETLKSHRETWKTQKREILKKYLSEEEIAKMEAHRKKKQERHAQHAPKKSAHKKGGKAVKFVLWDGEFKTPRHGKRGRKECKTTQEKGNQSEKLSTTKIDKNITLSNYPNPAITQTTILLTTKEEAKTVKIIINDADGKQVWMKQYAKLNAGEHKIDVNLRKFASGQYFYTVSIGEQSITKTLIVNQ